MEGPRYVLLSINEQAASLGIIGNCLHTDGLVASLKDTSIFKMLEFLIIRQRDLTGIERRSRLTTYTAEEAIDRKRCEPEDIGFRRELHLQIVSEEGQDVLPADVHYYDDRPFEDRNHLAHGVALSTHPRRKRVSITRQLSPKR